MLSDQTLGLLGIVCFVASVMLPALYLSMVIVVRLFPRTAGVAVQIMDTALAFLGNTVVGSMAVLLVLCIIRFACTRF